MSSSNSTYIEWFVGVQPRRQGKTLATAMARRGRTLADAIRDGSMKSAWGDNDTPDYIGLSGNESIITGGSHINPQHAERQRLEHEKFVEKRRAELKRIQEIADREAATEAMVELEGFGIF
jgi:hypothetical protein